MRRASRVMLRFRGGGSVRRTGSAPSILRGKQLSRTRRPTENSPAHEARCEVDQKTRGGAIPVQCGIEFDDIEAGWKPAFAEHLHRQMGFAERHAAGNRRPDAGGDGWIEEVG